MPKFNQVVGSVFSDAVSYFVTNKDTNKVANNAVVASTAVALPDIIHVVSNITAGVSIDNAVAAGGASMYIAFAIYAAKFVLYIFSKAKA